MLNKSRIARDLFVLVSLVVISCSGNPSKEDIAPSGMLRTHFDYEDPQLDFLGIATSAITRDAETENLVARAQLLRFITGVGGQMKGLVIKETHYGPRQRVIFSCESEFNMAGMKVGENRRRGNKVFDLYDTWPVSGGSSHWPSSPSPPSPIPSFRPF